MEDKLSRALTANRRRVVEAVLRKRGYDVDKDSAPQASLPKGFVETEQWLRRQGRVHRGPRWLWAGLRRWLRRCVMGWRSSSANKNSG